MSTREKVDALLADVVPRVGEIAGDAGAGIGLVRDDARAKISRHEAASAELSETEGEIEDLLREREEIPNRAYRAGLDEEYQLEDDLKLRYKNLKPAIEALEERRAALAEEIAALSPNDHGHSHDAKIHHIARVAMAAIAEREALEVLKEGLTKALDDALKPVVEAHEQSRALVQSWGQQVDRELRQRERIEAS